MRCHLRYCCCCCSCFVTVCVIVAVCLLVASLLSQSYTHHQPHIIPHSAAVVAVVACLVYDTVHRCSDIVGRSWHSSHLTTNRRRALLDWKRSHLDRGTNIDVQNANTNARPLIIYKWNIDIINHHCESNCFQYETHLSSFKEILLFGSFYFVEIICAKNDWVQIWFVWNSVAIPINSQNIKRCLNYQWICVI